MKPFYLACLLLLSASAAIAGPITIVTQPGQTSACVGQTATFSISATGTNLSYQWMFFHTAIPGANDSILNIPNVSDAEGGYYKCRIISGQDTVMSEFGHLTITTAIGISPSSQPQDMVVCQGVQTTITIPAGGNGLTYTWYRNGQISNITNNYQGSINVGNLSPGSYTYYCVLSNACGSLSSDTFTVSVGPNDFTIIQQPISSATDICQGDAITLSVQATGTIYSTQWQLNGADIPGATTQTYTIPQTSANSFGGYVCVFETPCGTKQSNYVLVNGIETTQITSLNINATADSVTATAVLNNTGLNGNVSFEWWFNGLSIGVTPNPYITFARPISGGNLTVQVLGGCNNLNGSLPSETTYISAVTGIAEAASNNNIKLFPNPAANNITIASIANYGNANISIYSALGALVYNKNLSLLGNQTIMLDGLTNGLYTVIVNSSKGEILTKEKLVVVR